MAGPPVASIFFSLLWSRLASWPAHRAVEYTQSFKPLHPPPASRPLPALLAPDAGRFTRVRATHRFRWRFGQRNLSGRRRLAGHERLRLIFFILDLRRNGRLGWWRRRVKLRAQIHDETPLFIGLYAHQ